jgi:hypothetical protein
LVCISIAPTIVDAKIVALLLPKFLKPLLQNADALTGIRVAFCDRHQDAKPPLSIDLLRTHR